MSVVGWTVDTEHIVVNIDSHIVRQVPSGSAVPADAEASGTQLLGIVIGPPAQNCGGGAWQTAELPALPALPAMPMPALPLSPPLPPLAPPLAPPTPAAAPLPAALPAPAALMMIAPPLPPAPAPELPAVFGSAPLLAALPATPSLACPPAERVEPGSTDELPPQAAMRTENGARDSSTRCDRRRNRTSFVSSIESRSQHFACQRSNAEIGRNPASALESAGTG